LRGGDAGVGALQLGWRDLCLAQRAGRIDAVFLVAEHDRPHEGHRGGGDSLGAKWRGGADHGGKSEGAWQDLQPSWQPMRRRFA
jgi:hypothetical protein